MSIQERIESKIRAALRELSHLSVENESRLHSFDPGGESHFKIVAVAGDFQGLILLKRHRLIQEAIKEEIGGVRAVSLHTLTPAEWNERAASTLDGSRCVGATRK